MSTSFKLAETTQPLIQDERGAAYKPSHFHVPVNLKVDSYPSPTPAVDAGMSAGAAVLATLGILAIAGISIWTWWRDKQYRERMQTLYARQGDLHKRVDELTRPSADATSRTAKVHTI